jgi:diguanylate cyclase (GGDEF)-like protein/PAS domain S-box-containing protein
MKTDRHFWTKLIVTSALTLLYIIGYRSISSIFGPMVGVLSALPVAIGGWLFGTWGGLASSVILIVCNYFLMDYYNIVHLNSLGIHDFLLIVIILLSIGLLFGRFSDIQKRLSHEVNSHRKLVLNLKATQAKYESIIQSNPAAVFLVDDHARILEVNPSACNLTGYKSDGLLKYQLGDLVDIEHKEIFRQMWKDFQINGQADGELALTRSDHQPSYIEYRVVKGNKSGINLFIATDITARKQSETLVQESESRLAKMFQTNQALGCIIEQAEDVILDITHGFTRLVGYSRDEVIGKSIVDLGIWVDLPEYRKAAAKPGSPDSLPNKPIQFRKKSGETGDGLFSFEQIKYQGKHCVLCMGIDATKTALEEDIIHSRKEIVDTILSSAPIGIMLVRNRCIEWVNDRLLEMVSYSADQLIGQDTRILYPTRKEYEQVGKELYCESGRFGVGQMDTRWVRCDGMVMDVHLQVHDLDKEDMNKGQIIAVVDITERKRVEESLRYMSTHDTLTGLYNRAYFEEELARLAKSRHFPLSFLICDVDGLKQTNDTSGHFIGDKLLTTAAQSLRAAFRDEDIIARLGGDEFIVLLPDTGEDAADLIIDRIRSELTKIARQPGQTHVNLSIGFASAQDAAEISAARRRADQRMYQDKVFHKSQKN